MKTLTILTLFFAVFLSTADMRTCSAIDFSSMSRITGQVQDATTRKPIGNATIALYSSKDSTQTAVTITNPDGSFSLSIQDPGSYYLTVSQSGFRKQVISLTSSDEYNRNIRLGIVYLQRPELLLL